MRLAFIPAIPGWYVLYSPSARLRHRNLHESALDSDCFPTVSLRDTRPLSLLPFSDGNCTALDGCSTKRHPCTGLPYQVQSRRPNMIQEATMSFHLIDLQTWDRKEFYEHFIEEVACTYSATVNLDITNLKNYRLYPTIIWLLTKAVNQIPEFRTALTNEGVGIYDELHPAYTIFNKENKNFSAIWTEFHSDYRVFLNSYECDTAKYASSVNYAPKPDRPANSFDISMIPWFTFTSFNINVFDSRKYLLPIFTFGKYIDDCGKRLLPLSIQVHHAVCDGYHMGKFIEILQEQITQFSYEG